jgi:hypothetical protein
MLMKPKVKENITGHPCCHLTLYKITTVTKVAYASKIIHHFTNLKYLEFSVVPISEVCTSAMLLSDYRELHSGAFERHSKT